MSEAHLTMKKVEQYCQTGWLGSGERAHLAGCPHCQRLVSDLRVIARLISRPSQETDEEHLTSDELRAFHDEALSFGRMKEVESHLAGCNYCLARVMELRVREWEYESVTPRPEIIEAVRSQFRAPGRVVRLGRLIIRRLKDTGKIFVNLEPVVAGVSPGFPWNRARLLHQDRQDFIPSKLDEISADYAVESLPAAAMSQKTMYRDKPPAQPEDTVHAESGEHEILVKVLIDGDSLLMNLSVTKLDTNEPVQGLKVHLYAQDDLTTDTVTSEDGSVVMPLSASASVLQIDTEPPIQFSISGDD